ncbi:ribosome biogenesis GTPase Der [Pelotomaculum isophthalicicum JI]|uniref:GTPase Der n=1 Tax=Pelotomaculum isophthalicicum JI TaxID=947010 RepID=A0A9X4JVF1_9FIRM|nr:ribosome biogenesis GTPase Der [Pelotomaculum isophthalicicum]MDF9407363.1 ribosome biogenesis GTPase Der [Pelotomaculum isophthalicicum JI]
MPKPVVAIVGRPNVGKSTLFNRIVGSRVAIVEDEPGVTRDRLYLDAEWAGRSFTLVDTGGLDFQENGEINRGVRRQIELAIQEANVILFVVDARAGLNPDDEEAATLIRRSEKQAILVANKIENFNSQTQLYEFYRLGLGEPVPVSAAEGLNTGDLLDRLVELLPPEGEDEYPADTIKIAVIGRPNVGKSSLVNTILGEERVIVSKISGTTRDAIDTPFERDGRLYVIIDTAGMRRKNKVGGLAEKYSAIRALRAVDRSDVVLIVLDAVEGVTDQDKRIAGYAHEAGKALVIVVNKWDLIKKDDRTMNRFTKKIRDELSFMQYAPVVFTSALTGQRVPRVLEQVDFVAGQHSMRLSTPNINSLIKEAVMQNPPPGDKTRRLKIMYATQGGVKPPKFILFVNDPELMHFSYRRYLENQFRNAYGFEGTPIWFGLRRRSKEEQ